MTIEKMKFVGISGDKAYLDKAVKCLIYSDSFHVVDALAQTKKNREISKELDEALSNSPLKTYEESFNYIKEEELLNDIKTSFNIDLEISKYNSNSKMIELNNSAFSQLHESVKDKKIQNEEFEKISKKVEEKKEYIKSLQYIRELDIDIEKLNNFSDFKTSLVLISKDGYKKVKANYEHIPAVVLHVGDVKEGSVILCVAIGYLWEFWERILKSLNYFDIKIPQGYNGSPSEVITQLEKELKEEKKKLDNIKNDIHKFLKENQKILNEANTFIHLEKKALEIKNKCALGNNLFYIFGYVPQKAYKNLEKQLNDPLLKGRVLIMPHDIHPEEKGYAPPTKLKNSKLFAPFEMMIGMYSTPNYEELDPTTYFGFTYMLLFGAMFGDVGQGLVVFILGLLVTKKIHKSFGGILTRLGFSSIIFGFLYGSIFGNEEAIEAVWIRPMENINQILIFAIIFGVLLLSSAYIFSLINAYKRKDIEEGIFGKEGLVGFLYFLGFAFTVANVFLKFAPVPIGLEIGILAVLLLIMVFKEPLAAIVKGEKELFKEGAGNYLMEQGFGSVEIILNVLSNMISFIRVGAFALNHVGLFMAFSAIGQMMNSAGGNFIMMLIGNIVIIGMEGLIVFIQSMRLEYYELFSKYFTGNGIKYEPISIRDNK